MNTRRYKNFYIKLGEDGVIPQDLCDSVVARINERGKMTREIYVEFLRELERRELFHVPTVPYTEKRAARTDGRYVYKKPKNPFWHMGHAILATIFKFLGWFGSGLVYGMWRFPRRYKKKLKGVGACITVSNHVGYIDAALVRRAMGMRKLYIVAAPYNCKRTLGGAILRSAIVVPLPSSFKGARPFNDMLEYLRDKKAAIHFYGEKNMWIRYRKPRPYLEGPFFYADKLDIPVVPMLTCFKESRGLRKLFGLPRAEIHVGDPVYPDKAMSPRARQKDMAERIAAATKQMYEEHYGVPLEFEREDGQAPARQTEENQ